MDVKGPRVCKKYYDEAGVTFPALVDTGDVLGRAMGFKVIPNEFYFDANGRYRGRINTTHNDDALERILTLPAIPPSAAPPDPWATTQPAAMAASNDAPFETLLADGKQRLASDPFAAAALLERVVTLKPESVDGWMTLAAAKLAAGDEKGALAALQKANALQPDDWLIRKQIWALEHPEKFYDGDIDYDWQREQQALEDAAARKKANFAPK